MSLMKNFPAPSAKNLLVALTLIATLSAIVIPIKKKFTALELMTWESQH